MYLNLVTLELAERNLCALAQILNIDFNLGVLLSLVPIVLSSTVTHISNLVRILLRIRLVCSTNRILIKSSKVP